MMGGGGGAIYVPRISIEKQKTDGGTTTLNVFSCSKFQIVSKNATEFVFWNEHFFFFAAQKSCRVSSTVDSEQEIL